MGRIGYFGDFNLELIDALVAQLGGLRVDRRRSARFVRGVLNRPGQVPRLVFCPSQDHSENGEGGDDGGNDESVGDRHGVLLTVSSCRCG